ncbi:MAG: type II toxin-antitoxin system ParD family antitoxin [Terracidiphilus sp.]|jgi:putative addiction module CopG family antidote
MPKIVLEGCCVPNRNVYLPPDLDDFVLTRVEGGRHSDASELVQAALRALEREERTNEAKRAALRAAMQGADARSTQGGDVFRKLWLAQFKQFSQHGERDWHERHWHERDRRERDRRVLTRRKTDSAGGHSSGQECAAGDRRERDRRVLTRRKTDLAVGHSSGQESVAGD